jgi:hypothetical protein
MADLLERGSQSRDMTTVALGATLEKRGRLGEIRADIQDSLVCQGSTESAHP